MGGGGYFRMWAEGGKGQASGELKLLKEGEKSSQLTESRRL